MPRYPKADTQEARVLRVLLDADGAWIHGQETFGRGMWLTQWHRAIHTLENKYGWHIEHSDFKDEHGFMSYRIVQEPATLPLAINV